MESAQIFKYEPGCIFMHFLLQCTENLTLKSTWLLPTGLVSLPSVGRFWFVLRTPPIYSALPTCRLVPFPASFPCCYPSAMLHLHPGTCKTMAQFIPLMPFAFPPDFGDGAHQDIANGTLLSSCPSPELCGSGHHLLQMAGCGHSICMVRGNCPCG